MNRPTSLSIWSKHARLTNGSSVLGKISIAKEGIVNKHSAGNLQHWWMKKGKNSSKRSFNTTWNHLNHWKRRVQLKHLEMNKWVTSAVFRPLNNNLNNLQLSIVVYPKIWYYIKMIYYIVTSIHNERVQIARQIWRKKK